MTKWEVPPFLCIYPGPCTPSGLAAPATHPRVNGRTK